MDGSAGRRQIPGRGNMGTGGKDARRSQRADFTAFPLGCSLSAPSKPDTLGSITCMCVCVGRGWGGTPSLKYNRQKESNKSYTWIQTPELLPLLTLSVTVGNHGQGHRLLRRVPRKEAHRSGLPGARSNLIRGPAQVAGGVRRWLAAPPGGTPRRAVEAVLSHHRLPAGTPASCGFLPPLGSVTAQARGSGAGQCHSACSLPSASWAASWLTDGAGRAWSSDRSA